LIYDSFYPLNNNGAADTLTKMMSSSAANLGKNYLSMSFHHKEILKIAEELYDELLKAAVNDTIYPSSNSANQQRNVIITNKCEN
jgi:hypothetical protein